TNFKVLGRVTLPGRSLKGYLDLPGNAIEERSLNGVLKLAVKEDFHHGTVDGGLRQLKHPLEPFIEEADALCAVRDHHSLKHAGEDRLQTEALISDLLIELLEQFRNPTHVTGCFPQNSFARTEQNRSKITQCQPVQNCAQLV